MQKSRISIYLSTIKTLYGVLNDNSLKILILDDLLISLDMNNRQKLLNLLKAEFTDFQTIFFTHDKSLFEVYKKQLNWKKYELYLDDSEEIPSVIKKLSNSDIEKANKFYATKDLEACALHLRKGIEKTVKKYIPINLQRDKNCNPLDLAALLDKAILISKDNENILELLEKLHIDRAHILNPLSHDDDTQIYQIELKESINTLEKLNDILANTAKLSCV